MSKINKNFDAYNDDLELDEYRLETDEDFEDDINEFNSVPTVNRLNGSYGYDDEQWD